MEPFELTYHGRYALGVLTALMRPDVTVDRIVVAYGLAFNPKTFSEIRMDIKTVRRIIHILTQEEGALEQLDVLLRLDPPPSFYEILSKVVGDATSPGEEGG